MSLSKDVFNQLDYFFIFGKYQQANLRHIFDIYFVRFTRKGTLIEIFYVDII